MNKFAIFGLTGRLGTVGFDSFVDGPVSLEGLVASSAVLRSGGARRLGPS